MAGFTECADGVGRYQIKKLDLLGFAWEPQDEAWRIGYAIAKAYAQEFGNLNVIGDCVYRDFGLGIWVSYWRSRKKDNKITKEQEELLNDLGMIWDTREEAWERNYRKAEQYFANHGDLKIPSKDPLWCWIKINRQKRRKGKLTQDQAVKLSRIGM